MLQVLLLVGAALATGRKPRLAPVQSPSDSSDDGHPGRSIYHPPTEDEKEVQYTSFDFLRGVKPPVYTHQVCNPHLPLQQVEDYSEEEDGDNPLMTLSEFLRQSQISAEERSKEVVSGYRRLQVDGTQASEHGKLPELIPDLDPFAGAFAEEYMSKQATTTTILEATSTMLSDEGKPTAE